jgi:hypothetical protein
MLFTLAKSPEQAEELKRENIAGSLYAIRILK